MMGFADVMDLLLRLQSSRALLLNQSTTFSCGAVDSIPCSSIHEASQTCVDMIDCTSERSKFTPR
jgi:hypothetical protein